MEKNLSGLINRFFRIGASNRRSLLYRSIYLAFSLLLCFSILGLVWSIPVPEFDFLGKLNGYLNLATVLIISVMLYCLRQSVKLAFAAGIIICVFSAGIIMLEKMERTAHWPDMGFVCFGIFVVSGTCVFVLRRDY